MRAHKVHLGDYREGLKQELQKLLSTYSKRGDAITGFEHKHVTGTDLKKYTASGIALGGSLGTIVPGIGNAIGVGAGAIAGFVVAGSMEIRNYRNNIKRDNAQKILNFFGKSDHEQRECIIKLATAVIDQRRVLISRLQETPENRNVTAYLAAAIMATIKNSGENPELDDILRNIGSVKSSKVSSRYLSVVTGGRLTSQEIAENKPERDHAHLMRTTSVPLLKGQGLFANREEFKKSESILDQKLELKP